MIQFVRSLSCLVDGILYDRRRILHEEPTFLFTDILTGCDDIRTSCALLMEFCSNFCPKNPPRIEEFGPCMQICIF